MKHYEIVMPFGLMTNKKKAEQLAKGIRKRTGYLLIVKEVKE